MLFRMETCTLRKHFDLQIWTHREYRMEDLLTGRSFWVFPIRIPIHGKLFYVEKKTWFRVNSINKKNKFESLLTNGLCFVEKNPVSLKSFHAWIESWLRRISIVEQNQIECFLNVQNFLNCRIENWFFEFKFRLNKQKIIKKKKKRALTGSITNGGFLNALTGSTRFIRHWSYF